MKYLAFVAGALVIVPLVAALAWSSARYRRWLLAALVFSTAIGDMSGVNFFSQELYRGPDRGFEVTLTDLLAWGLGIALVLRHGGRLRYAPPGTVALCGLFAAGVLTMLWAPVPLYTAFTLWKWVRLFVLYLVLVNSLVLECELVSMRLGLTAMGLVMTGLAVKQKYLDHIYRIPGPFDHSNTIPLYLNLVIPVLLAWALMDRSLKRSQAAIMLVAVLGMLFTVVATFSRLGMALAGVAALGALAIVNLKGRTPRSLLASGLVVVLLVAGAAKASGAILERIRTAPESSEEARDEFNLAADMMARDHLLGVGLNNFSRVLSDDARYNRFLDVMENETEAGVCHHIYRLTAAELGYGGLLLLAGLLGQFLWLTVRWAWRGRSLESALLAAQGLGFLALHTSGFFEWAFRITPVAQAFTIHCAFAVALAAAARRRGTT